ncbi:MAG: putative zinc-binding metallopeptidase [Chloroflexota bacterium]|nr:putative zinc-binding metallopeptidase [Chloroflexota bacterium]
MSQRANATQKRSGSATRVPRNRHSRLAVNRPGDRYEQEADRIADAVAGGASGRPDFSIAAVPIVQRQDRDIVSEMRGIKKPKPEEEKYKEAAKKVGDAFLETAPGKEIKAKAEQLGDAFISTLPGKIIAGTALAGAVAALAATHSELPIGIPEISLDKIKPGLKMQITYEGPVDKPTKVMATFTYKFGPAPKAPKKPAMSKSERFRAETARMQLEQHKFRESMKTPEEKAQDQAMINAWLMHRNRQMGLLPGLTPGAAEQTYGPQPDAGKQASPDDLKLKGETKTPSRAEMPKKKEEGSLLMRKATGQAEIGHAPSQVHDALQSPGRPLDDSTLSFMETRFGHSFAHVRIHTDAGAGQSARAVSSHAYTVGSDVVFASGQYSPHTAAGRHLLAHELAHVVQQTGPAPLSPGLVLQRKEGEEGLSPEEMLKHAVEGDDDAVRELVDSQEWGKLTFDVAQGSQLIVNLLDGATGDDDELAGLGILRKALKLSLFDDLLLKLKARSRFGQLMDDYHGAEYRDLLDLLSGNIKHLKVKVAYLDEFVVMWWVREHEERAVVLLLEKSAMDEKVKLLTDDHRRNELRDAIDNRDLSFRYEKIIGEANQGRQQDLKIQLRNIFGVEAAKTVKAGKRTQAEVDRLLVAATVDLTRELLDYREQLDDLLKAKPPDFGQIRKLNKEFEERLKALIVNKTAEFGLELKYNLEFNRLLDKTYGLSWTPEDLKFFDRRILSRIPPEILLANPKFRRILRAREHPDVAGRAPMSGRYIKLYGGLTFGTTVHELGHILSRDEAHRLMGEFITEFKWEHLTKGNLKTHVRNDGKRERLIKRMEADRKNKRTKAKHRHGDHYYKYDKKSDDADPMYFRFPVDSCFVSSYATVHPNEDFAETFEEYVKNPNNLYDSCKKKYQFMRRNVFGAYLFDKQRNRLLGEFDAERKRQLTSTLVASLRGGDFAVDDHLNDKHLDPLRTELRKALAAEKKAVATSTAKDERPGEGDLVPFKSADVRATAAPFLRKLKAIVVLSARLAQPWSQHSLALDGEMKKVPAGVFFGGGQRLRHRLDSAFQTDALAALDLQAKKILDGKESEVDLEPGLNKLISKFQSAVKVFGSYAPVYHALASPEFQVQSKPSSSQARFGPFGAGIMSQIPPGDARRTKVETHILSWRKKLVKQRKKLVVDIFDNLLAGISFVNSGLEHPDVLLKEYKADVRKFARKQGLAIRRKSQIGQETREVTDAAGLQMTGAGQPLPGETRTLMERSLGLDFSQVRIHADSSAARSARSVHALAYTIGSHIVFDAGQFAPSTPGGQWLLAHELTHVAQQGQLDGVNHDSLNEQESEAIPGDLSASRSSANGQAGSA